MFFLQKVLFMIKYISVFRLVRRFLLVVRKENLTGISTGLTGRSKNLDPTGNPTGAGRPDRFPSLIWRSGVVIFYRSNQIPGGFKYVLLQQRVIR